MDLDIRGKTALVTASSDGIGANVARSLAREGVNVVLFARSADKLEVLAETLAAESGVKALPVVGSMLDSADLNRLFTTIRDRFGQLDIAVLNTGRAPAPLRKAIDETEDDRWTQSYRMLLASVVQIAQRAYPMMAEKGWGRLIAVTSASVHLPMPHHALSTVFRAGVEAYIKHLSSEIGRNGITANCVAPALIESPHRAKAVSYTPEQVEMRKKMSPLQRLGTQEELCGVITFLASAQAGFVSGEVIRVDGGMSAALPVH